MDHETNHFREIGRDPSQQSLLSNQGTRAWTCHRVRWIGSTRAIVVLVWTALVCVSVGNPAFKNLFGYQFQAKYVVASTACLSLVVLVSPIAGLLASIRFGRYKTLYVGLWMVWIGNALSVPLGILQQLFPESQAVLYYCGSMVSLIVFFVGFFLYLLNALPFGLDQMPDASGEQIGAFVHWYVWIILVGLITDLIVSIVNLVPLACSLLTVLPPTVALCSAFFLCRWLIIEPEGENPLRTFCKVLRFATKHKVPVRRSAFTFWEEEKPSRIDLAKSKYGGPFTFKEVEDVKTCLRMIVVIVSSSGILITAATYFVSMSDALQAEFVSDSNSKGRKPEYLAGFLVTLSVPVYELVIYPHVRKWIPSMMKRVGLSQVLVILASLFMLVSSVIWYTYASPTTCIFFLEASSPLPVDRFWIATVSNTVTGIFVIFINIAILEFVSAQAPYVLKGLLVGLVYSVEVASIAIGIGVYTAWKNLYREKAPDRPSCGVWFYLYTTISTVLGFALWCVVAKWYKRRVIQEPEMCRIFAENYYSH